MLSNMKIKKNGLVLLTLVLLIFSSCFNSEEQSSRKSTEIITIVDHMSPSTTEHASFYSDFYVKNDVVYILCHLTLENSASSQQSFTLTAIMPEDVKLGLLKTERLPGYDSDIQNTIFSIDAATTQIYDVVFVGEFAGKEQKSNRLLPQIEITILDSQ